MATGPHRRAVQCHLCGEMFFPASMKFHVKACEKKQRSILVECPYCNRQCPRLDLASHMAKCKSRPQAAAAAPETGNASEGSAADTRVACSTCGRKFAPERIAVHERACNKLNSGTQRRGRFNAVQGGTATSSSGDASSSSADGTFGSPPPLPQHRRPRTAAASSTRRPKRKQRAQTSALGVTAGAQPSAPSGGGGGAGGGGAGGGWREKHEQLQQAMRLARKVAAHERAGTLDELGPIQADPHQHVGLIPCPHCGRTFSPERAAKHIPVCANIVNRPRPPPTADGSNSIRGRGLGGGGGVVVGGGGRPPMPWLRRPATASAAAGSRGSGGRGKLTRETPSDERQSRVGGHMAASPRAAADYEDEEDMVQLPGIPHPGSQLTPPRHTHGGATRRQQQRLAASSAGAGGVTVPGSRTASLSSTSRKAPSSAASSSSLLAGSSPATLREALRAADEALATAAAALEADSGAASSPEAEPVLQARRLVQQAMSSASRPRSGRVRASGASPASNRPAGMTGGFSGTSPSQLRRPGTSSGLQRQRSQHRQTSFGSTSARFSSTTPDQPQLALMQGARRPDVRTGPPARALENATSSLSPLATEHQRGFARSTAERYD